MRSQWIQKRPAQWCLGLTPAVAAAAIVLTRVGSAAPSSAPKSVPVFTHPTAVTNSYLPLASLKQDILEGTEGGKPLRVVRSVKPGTKLFTVNGHRVPALIMEDREFVRGTLEEVALDYFVQADDGAVYYMGEDVDNYKHGRIVGHEGAWLYGVQTQQMGLLLPAHPRMGDHFQSENVPGITREDNQVVGTAERIRVPAGTFTNCLKIREKLSDGAIEYKYYAPRVGVVQELPTDGMISLKTHRSQAPANGGQKA